MSEKMPEGNTEGQEQEPKPVSPYNGLDRSVLSELASLREGNEDSATPHGDLRTAVRKKLEAAGDTRAFRRVYDMDNAQLDSFVDGASGELHNRRVGELQGIIAAYDSNESFANRRPALREALEAAGDTAAFRNVYNMDNQDITRFVNDARHELEDITRLDKDAALDEAYDEYEVQEGTPYDVDKDRVKSIEDARALADLEIVRRFITEHPELAVSLGIADRLRDLRARLETDDDEGELPPKIDEDEGDLPPRIDDDDEGDLPPKIEDDEKTDDDEGDLPPKIDDDEKTGDVDDADKGETGDGKPDDNPTAELPPVAHDNEATPDRRRFSRLRDRLLKIGVIFQNGLHRSIDRLRSSNKKEVAAIVGGVAVIGALMVMWRTGVFHGGGGGNVHPADTLPHGGGNTLPPSPTEVLPSAAPKLPGSEGYAYPWNWAHDAAPKGVNPETWLHELGDKAAAAGHAVEWHKGAGDVEWVSVDGNSNTRGVIDALRPFAQ